MKNSLISFILIFSVSLSASQENIREGLKNILPDGAVIELIEPSPIPKFDLQSNLQENTHISKPHVY